MAEHIEQALSREMLLADIDDYPAIFDKYRQIWRERFPDVPMPLKLQTWLVHHDEETVEDIQERLHG